MLSRVLRQRALAMVFDGPKRPFIPTHIPIPQTLREGEVLVKMNVATICGSDLHTFTGKRAEPTPLVLGHEGVGEIISIGSDILGGSRPRRHEPAFQVGSRVTWTIADSCGVCVECVLHKLPQKCKTLTKYGHSSIDNGYGLNGTYATHIVLRSGTHITTLPDDLTPDVWAPVNCALATVANSLDMQRLPRYGSNNSAVVQGAGLLGIYAVAWLKHHIGMDKVFCLDVNPNRLSTAKKFGAETLLIDPNNPRGAEERLEAISLLAPHGVDVVVEMTGAKQVVTEGINLLRNGGHYAFCGMVHPDSFLTQISGEQIVRKCLTIRGTHNYTPWHLEESVRFLADNTHLPWNAVLGEERYPLRELDNAFAAALSGSACRVVVDCQA